MSPKYPKPKILLIDMEDQVSAPLKALGHQVDTGTFGLPYRVNQSSDWSQVIGDADLPNVAEQEVVVVDLSPRSPQPRPFGAPRRPRDETDRWAKGSTGVVDPRPFLARENWPVFQRIYDHGGVFVVFAAHCPTSELAYGHFDAHYEFQMASRFPVTAWYFLDQLAKLTVVAEEGAEIRTDRSQRIARHFDGARYLCKFPKIKSDEWDTLSTNKYGDPIALLHHSRSSGGVVLVLPQVRDKAALLHDLLTTTLPELAPHLFPHLEGGRWVHRPEYELPRIKELATERARVQEAAAREYERLDQEAEAERRARGWIHDLITGHDDVLVGAVKRALSTFGFKQVIDVDEERDKAGKSRREDLIVRDADTLLVIDIKGIGGCPSDPDVLQAMKHMQIRMQDEKTTDVHALSIINHERHMPALERNNATPFREELLQTADGLSLGLMTAWDLYRLAINYDAHAWRPENVMGLFYKAGRIDAVPLHYEHLGEVAHVWRSAFSVVLKSGDVNVGDRIAVEVGPLFEEAEVTSLQANSQERKQIRAGEEAGISWAGQWKLREKMRVFRVRRTAS